MGGGHSWSGKPGGPGPVPGLPAVRNGLAASCLMAAAGRRFRIKVKGADPRAAGAAVGFVGPGLAMDAGDGRQGSACSSGLAFQEEAAFQHARMLRHLARPVGSGIKPHQAATCWIRTPGTCRHPCCPAPCDPPACKWRLPCGPDLYRWSFHGWLSSCRIPGGPVPCDRHDRGRPDVGC